RHEALPLEEPLASIRDAVVAVDTTGRVTFMNTAAQTLTGWRLDEAAGQPLQAVVQVVDEPSWRPFRPSSPTVLQQETAVETVTTPVLVGRHGSGVAIEERAWPLRTEGGDTLGGVLVLRDVSQRRVEEVALRESEEHLRFLADTVPGMVWTAGPDGRTDFANQRW